MDVFSLGEDAYHHIRDAADRAGQGEGRLIETPNNKDVITERIAEGYNASANQHIPTAL